MRDFKKLLGAEDPTLIKQSLELLEAFRAIKDPRARQSITDLAHALRPEETAPRDPSRDARPNERE